MVEAHVVCDEHSTVKQRDELRPKPLKIRCITHHGVRDAREPLNKEGNRLSRVDQRFPTRADDAIVDPDERDFRDAMINWVDSRGFKVKQDITGQHGDIVQ